VDTPLLTTRNFSNRNT